MHQLQPRRFLLFFYLISLLLYRIFGYTGHFGFDDMEYAKIAFDLINGNFDYANHFSYRFSLVLPTALSYYLFGVNDIASSFPPLIASGCTLLLVYKMLKDKPIYLLAIALSITLFSEWFLFYSNKIMTAPYVTLAFTFILYILYQLRTQSSEKQIKNAFLFSLGLLFGFISKGTILLILPLLVFLFVHDIWFKKNKVFWKYSIAFFTLLLSLYFISFYIFTGNMFERFNAIQANSYINKCSYAAQPFQVVLKRISTDFILMLRNEGFLYTLVFILLPLAYYRSFNFLKLSTPIGFFISCASLLLLSANFMTISFSSYNPMCLDFRHYLFLVPPAGIVVALVLYKKNIPNAFKIICLLLLSIICVNSYLADSRYFLRLYLPLVFLVLTFFTYDNKFFKQKLFPLLFTATLLVQPYFMITLAQQNDYPAQVKFIKQNIASQEGSMAIMTDPVQSRIGSYLIEFDTNKKFLPYNEIGQVIEMKQPKVLLLNAYTEFFAATNRYLYPYYVKNTIKKGVPKFQNKALNIKLYKLDSIVEPKITGKLIAHTFQDFEDNYPNWQNFEQSITDSVNFNGSYSSDIAEYSATYQIDIDTSIVQQKSDLYIELKAQTLVKDSTEILAVATTSVNDSTLFWRGDQINEFQKVFTNWWPIKIEFVIPANQLHYGTKLKIYFWNKEREKAIVDNIEINVYSF